MESDREEYEIVSTEDLTPAAERILTTASRLFYEEGIRAVGVDAISEQADVSKVTLYKNFGSKGELVAAYLRLRDERWRAVLARDTDRYVHPTERLLAFFDAYGEYLFDEEGYRGCAFINAAAELPDTDHPAWSVIQEHKDGIWRHLSVLATEAGFKDPEATAERLLILLEGAWVTAVVRRSVEPLDCARDIAVKLLTPDHDG
ncbi:TetR/AcrR family transcriptional regulator [soil metagenome]